MGGPINIDEIVRDLEPDLYEAALTEGGVPIDVLWAHITAPSPKALPRLAAKADAAIAA